ncbi:heavy-metal-associated domain-containing protein [Flavobacterium sp.]|uniref:heavy-metal-associated domain-containing protein n=1 Tax=Flavobacterium sp. TaxID=239 RepID=UPI002631A16D|nr:heavy-metal-associated domain-containing protein [Flavobacterium sp.]MDD3004991.1 heavy-metal-associated domain-containing protein [Flavobacterium sp.]
MKKIFLIVVIALFSGHITAQEKKNKNANHNIEVKGNCEMCKKRIEKAAYSVSGVKSASWDINTKSLSLIVNEEKSTLNDVEKAITKVGHDAGKLKAADENYEKLHHCCMYER